LPSKQTKKKTKATRRPQDQKVHLRESRNPGNLRPKVPRMARAIRPRNDHPNGSEDAHKKGYLILNMGEELQDVYLETSRPMNRGAVRLRQLCKENCKFTDIDKEGYCSSS
jgi:hypothetical protein